MRGNVDGFEWQVAQGAQGILRQGLIDTQGDLRPQRISPLTRWDWMSFWVRFIRFPQRGPSFDRR